MKKGFFVITENDYAGMKNEHCGVGKKIKTQFEVFSKNFEMNYYVIENEKSNLLTKISSRLPFGAPPGGMKIPDALDFKKCDFIYIRKPVGGGKFLKLLQKIRIINPKIKIILEIPTYPYEKEIVNIKEYPKTIANVPVLLKDRYMMNRIQGYVDRVATFSQDEEISGVETIKIMNGIDVSKINCVLKGDTKEFDQDINLIAVAAFRIAHGYDRVIKGLNNYYLAGGSRKIRLHLVGEGPELPKYKQLVSEYNLEKCVIFYGTKHGLELEKIYTSADIGLCTFGIHRLGITGSSVLKSREYLAYGLPLVSSSRIDVFQNNIFDYKLYVSEDEKNVDIETIVEFYDKIFINKSADDVKVEIRKFAEEKVDMKKTMDIVVKYIKES